MRELKNKLKKMKEVERDRQVSVGDEGVAVSSAALAVAGDTGKVWSERILPAKSKGTRSSACQCWRRWDSHVFVAQMPVQRAWDDITGHDDKMPSMYGESAQKSNLLPLVTAKSSRLEKYPNTLRVPHWKLHEGWSDENIDC